MTRTHHAVLLALAVAALACGGPRAPEDFLVEEDRIQESAQLGGQALAVRKLELERAQRDMMHFDATLGDLEPRRDRNGRVQFTGFLEAYMGQHLDPLLRSEWQSQHPELMALDASIRLLKAGLLVRMRDPRRAQHEIDEIVRRYTGRETMLVDFPAGRQNTLGDALQMLADRKWRG